MATYSEDRQVLMRKENGTFFQAAVTHKEKKGVHWIIVSAADNDLADLRNSAPAMLALIAKEHGIPADIIRYFERGRDGAVFAVDPRNATAAAPAPSAPPVGVTAKSDPKPPRRGVWCDEVDLIKRVGKVRLPQVDPSLTLTPAQGVVSPPAKRNAQLAQPAQPVQAATRSQRPRYPRPR